MKKVWKIFFVYEVIILLILISGYFIYEQHYINENENLENSECGGYNVEIEVKNYDNMPILENSKELNT